MEPSWSGKGWKMAIPEVMDNLRERMEKYLPQSNLFYGALIANAAYKGLLDIAGTKLFYADHSSLAVMTPTITYKGIQSLALFWDEEEDEKDVVSMLATLPSIDWDESIFIYASPLVLMKKLEKWINERTLGNGYLKSVEVTNTYYYSLTSDPLIQISLPDGYEIRYLQRKHSQIMLNNWKYNGGETKEGYESMVATAPGVGVFVTKEPKNREIVESVNSLSMPGRPDDTSGESVDDPVAWSHLSFFNYISNTFTLPSYRGLGLAKAVTIALAKKALQDTGIASTYIVVNNEVSIAMHEKLGFTRHHEVNFQYYKSTLHPSEPYIENL